MMRADPLRRKLHLGGSRTLKGAALVVALLEAVAAHARPDTAALRLNGRNTPLPGGDAYETGRGLLAAGDVTGAMAAFRQALLDAPQSVDTLNAIAVCYDRLGRYDVSRSYYDTALTIAPGSPEVLNNLGYSLYLQGELRGAIPMLQQAAASGDPQAVATSRRLLQLIGVKLREADARASMAQAVAELKAPQARVELAANGEHRLVLAPAAPRPELVASLGDKAALTMVPKVWTQRDQNRLDSAEAARARAETAAILAEVATLTAADAALRATPLDAVALADPARALAFTAAFPIFPKDAPRTTLVVAPPVADKTIVFTPALAAMDRPTPAVAPAAASMASVDGKQLRKAKKSPSKSAASAENMVAGAAPNLAAGTAPPVASVASRTALLVSSVFGYVAPPAVDASAWIVASRRAAPPRSLPRIAGQSPGVAEAFGGFDSDDAVLNAFAARMRGAINDNQAIEVTAEVAISRLEALIARLRRA